MENGIMSFNAGEGLDITATNFDALISYAEHSDDYWVIKDNQHHHCYVNKVCKYYSDIPDNFNIEGRLVSELPTFLADYQDVVHTADSKILSSKKESNCTLTLKYGVKRDSTQLFMCNAASLIKNDEVIGMVVRARKLELFTMESITGSRSPGAIQFGNPSELFSNREFEVVFYILQRLCAQEIAGKMFLAVRTVENHTQTIYEKAGVSGPTARYQFIAWCRDKGYDRYVPQKFLSAVPIQFFG